MSEARKRSRLWELADFIACFRAHPHAEQGERDQAAVEERKDERPKKRSCECGEEPAEKIASSNGASFDRLRHAEERDLNREVHSGKSHALTTEGQRTKQFLRMRRPMRTTRAAAD